MKCKLTDNIIKPFMSFGKMPLANGFLNKVHFDSEFFFDMEVGFSEKISLFQLNDHPAPKKMFSNKYPFYTGSSNLMKIHFKKYSKWFFEGRFKESFRGSFRRYFRGYFKKSFRGSSEGYFKWHSRWYSKW